MARRNRFSGNIAAVIVTPFFPDKNIKETVMTKKGQPYLNGCPYKTYSRPGPAIIEALPVLRSLFSAGVRRA